VAHGLNQIGGGQMCTDCASANPKRQRRSETTRTNIIRGCVMVTWSLGAGNLLSLKTSVPPLISRPGSAEIDQAASDRPYCGIYRRK